MPTMSYVIRVGILSAVYFSTATFGLMMGAVGGFATLVWPPTGISLAALLLFGLRLWPGIALGAFLVNVVTGAPVVTAGGMALGNTLEAVIGAYALRRTNGFRNSLDRLRDVMGLIVVAAVFSTTVSATVGVSSLWLGGVVARSAYPPTWLAWWLGDMIGDLVVAPLLLTWGGSPSLRTSGRRAVEAGCLALSIIVVSLIVFRNLVSAESEFYSMPYVMFPLVIWAAIRFGPRGAATATFMVSAIAIWGTAQGHGPFRMELLSDRLIYLQAFMGIVAVTAMVLAAVVAERAQSEQKSRDYAKELEYVLAAWPRVFAPDVFALVRDLLERTASVLGAPRVLVAWEEAEEPWLHLALWSRREFRGTREPPGTWEPLVAEPLAGTAFLCPDAGAPVPAVLYTAPQGPRHWGGAPLHPEFQARFAVGPLLSASLSGDALKGRLFWLDKAGMTSNDLVLGEIVARRMAARMDHFYLLQRLRQAAAAEEAIRLARDLHDGLLQSLTAATLQLETVRRLLAEQPEIARDRLLEVQRLIAAEQRDVRAFVRVLTPAVLAPTAADSSLAARLDELVKWIDRQWGLRVELKMDRPEAWIAEGLAQQTYLMIHEALLNAARHAHASVVRVDLEARDSHLRITVADNGRGFAFRGRYDQAALTERGLGPASLKERIASLGGTLAIDSTESGARLEIALPLARPRASDAH
jgi:signal transduction histidine kinase